MDGEASFKGKRKKARQENTYPDLVRYNQNDLTASEDLIAAKYVLLQKKVMSDLLIVQKKQKDLHDLLTVMLGNKRWKEKRNIRYQSQIV